MPLSPVLPKTTRRRSKLHGWGVFASESINKNTFVIEYTGELISNNVSDAREDTYLNEGCIWVFRVNRAWSRDAHVGGNNARFINHSCAPNCEPIAYGDHIWIVAVRRIRPDEELAYDYAIELDEPHTPARKRRFPCACGAKRCRGSILKPKRQPAHQSVRRAIARWGPHATG